MSIIIRSRGSWDRIIKSIQKAAVVSRSDRILAHYGEAGVRYLSEATPKDTGRTAASWSYKIEKGNGTTSLVFSNSNTVKGVNIAIILQYGHGTRNGGYVQGIDYINPASQRIFQQMADELWLEVKSA